MNRMNEILEAYLKKNLLVIFRRQGQNECNKNVSCNSWRCQKKAHKSVSGIYSLCCCCRPHVSFLHSKACLQCRIWPDIQNKFVGLRILTYLRNLEAYYGMFNCFNHGLQDKNTPFNSQLVINSASIRKYQIMHKHWNKKKKTEKIIFCQKT